MIYYILRRLLYSLPILVGVNVITFFLFFFVNSPEDMARFQLGNRRITPELVANWKQTHGYDVPLFYNSAADGLERLRQTIFYRKSISLLFFDFGRADDGRDISHDISRRMWPSLAVAVPAFILGLLVDLTLALVVVLFLGSAFDRWTSVVCVLLMSISGMFFIIAGQYLFGQVWKLFPISGYMPGVSALRFVFLPVIIGVIHGAGLGVRLYRTIFVEEISKDYVRTARAKGLSEARVLFCHVLPNGLLPILTGVVVVIPTLFLGSLVMESFFSIPGLGGYTIDAIRSQDFAIVRSMVYLGSVLYITGLILTDIAYAAADPRVRLS